MFAPYVMSCGLCILSPCSWCLGVLCLAPRVLACDGLASCLRGIAVLLSWRLGSLGISAVWRAWRLDCAVLVLLVGISVVFAFIRHAVLLSWRLGVLRAALLSCSLGNSRASPQWLNRVHLNA